VSSGGDDRLYVKFVIRQYNAIGCRFNYVVSDYYILFSRYSIDRKIDNIENQVVFNVIHFAMMSVGRLFLISVACVFYRIFPRVTVNRVSCTD